MKGCWAGIVQTDSCLRVLLNIMGLLKQIDRDKHRETERETDQQTGNEKERQRVTETEIAEHVCQAGRGAETRQD